VWAEDGERSKKVEQEKKVSARQRWDKARATKKVVFWAVLGAIVLTMIVGFNWGGWVTGGTAQAMGETMADDAVVQRLAPICVFQFNQDPDKAQKLMEFNEVSNYKRDDYVKEQGWATMPGEDQPDRQVAEACASLLEEINQ
jgi:predicted phage tail protein